MLQLHRRLDTTRSVAQMSQREKLHDMEYKITNEAHNSRYLVGPSSSTKVKYSAEGFLTLGNERYDACLRLRPLLGTVFQNCSDLWPCW